MGGVDGDGAAWLRPRNFKWFLPPAGVTAPLQGIGRPYWSLNATVIIRRATNELCGSRSLAPQSLSRTSLPKLG